MSHPAALRLRRTTVVALALLTAGTTVGLSPARAADTVAVRQHRAAVDFNGDGYEDVAVGAPSATVSDRAKAGYVAVLYGAPEGLGAGKKVFHQASPGVPGTPETDDGFGESLTADDLDGDGYTDLVVESRRETWGADGIVRTGSNTVLWGGPNGFASGTVLRLLGTSAYQGGRTVSGDFDGDGHRDLLQQDRVAYGPFGRDGVPARTARTALVEGDMNLDDVVAGDTDGDGITDLVTLARSFDWDDDHNYGYQLNHLRGSRAGLAEPRILRDAQGRPVPVGDVSLAVGDVTGDGRADIVTGGDTLGVLPGTADGPAVAVPRVISQDSPGVPGVQEAGDGFGRSLAIGDVDGDGYGDVLAGIPFEDFAGLENAGTFAVVPGGPQGPTGAGTVVLSQHTTQVPGTAESADMFAENAALVDSDADGRAEPVVAAVGEDQRAGAVWVFRTSSAGVQTGGSFSFGARTLGQVKTGGWLGRSLSS
ncbi:MULTISPECIES: FG-GAP-like repeat-containing protein [unclassified Streptomyces]|uniref:FG-GAP-like repeat-containing protein n=1 Tax=unclassified Streptomyces TaxID=2593676 RepID=UPI00093D42B8|nr:FG-GAP-like repeat-containing protein [Streptomyces sp. TSRI0107]OKJ90553.1 hypothetical protein AMK31_02095 [Streptomyces sp. TSRI0107]